MNFGNVIYKLDVYRFRMSLLEMVGGKKNIHVTMEKTDQVYTAELDYNHLDEKEK